MNVQAVPDRPLLPQEAAPSPNGAAAVPKVEKFRWVIEDAPGTFRMISKTQLLIDHEYQRSQISENRVLALARSWSWIACGTLTIAVRHDKTLWLIDGQHRKLAADKRSDIEYLPCMCFGTSSKAEEADGFLNVNTNRGAMKAIEKFNAQVVAGDPAAIAIRDVILHSGRRVHSSADRSSIACVGTLISSFRLDESAFSVAWNLSVILLSDRVFNHKLFDALFFLERWLRANRSTSLTEPKFRNSLIAAGAEKLLQKIAASAGYYSKGGSKVYAAGLASVLDFHRKSGRINFEME